VGGRDDDGDVPSVEMLSCPSSSRDIPARSLRRSQSATEESQWTAATSTTLRRHSATGESHWIAATSTTPRHHSATACGFVTLPALSCGLLKTSSAVVVEVRVLYAYTRRVVESYAFHLIPSTLNPKP
jgi:hypothetical protein